MKKFKCHKIISAEPISGIAKDRTKLYFSEDDPCEMPVHHLPENNGYQPKEGDYLVEYEDGYRSVSPKKAFEDGYTLMPGGEPSENNYKWIGEARELAAQCWCDDEFRNKIGLML